MATRRLSFTGTDPLAPGRQLVADRRRAKVQAILAQHPGALIHPVSWHLLAPDQVEAQRAILRQQGAAPAVHPPGSLGAG